MRDRPSDCCKRVTISGSPSTSARIFSAAAAIPVSGFFSPIEVPALGDLLGLWRTHAIDHRGAAYAWGQNNFGQRGDGSITGGCGYTLVIGLLGPVISTAESETHPLFAVRVLGRVRIYGAGLNASAQLSGGLPPISPAPALIPAYVDLCTEQLDAFVDDRCPSPHSGLAITQMRRPSRSSRAREGTISEPSAA